MLKEQLKYMYGLERFGIKLGLEVMTVLLRELGNPHQQFQSVHITGTNGKGSTAAMLESVLRTAGLKTALYTSPHLFSFNERIRINNISISDHELGWLIKSVKNAAERNHLQPTFFEFTTAIAFCYFAAHEPDIAIIEVGMGGLLDATNVITPRVSVITNIDLDHTWLLGKTKAAIAANKAGIIKPDVPVVTGEKDQAIVTYLQEMAQSRNTYIRLASEVKTELVWQNYHEQYFNAFLQNPPLTREGLASFRTRPGVGLSLPLLGRHQIDNVTTVLLVLDELAKQGLMIDINNIKQGLAGTRWPGRVEVLSEKPFILVDGAHNPQSLLALHNFLTDPTTRPNSYDVLIVGMKNDKDISILRDTLAPLFSHIITTEGSYEPMPAEELANTLRGGSGRTEVLRDPQEATQRGLELIGEHGSLVVTGSLYMIPQALAYLRQKLSARASKAAPAAL
jgi:dihydrofolate synthase/folylpolyglutamate synthase